MTLPSGKLFEDYGTYPVENVFTNATNAFITA